MMKLVQGSIVWMDGVLDENGVNPKKRGLILVTENEEIATAEFLHFVCITGEFKNPIPPESVNLPYTNGRRHPRTGLSKECVAVCKWIQKVPRSDVPEPSGCCPGPQLLRILQIMNDVRSSI